MEEAEKKVFLEKCNATAKGTMVEYLDIQYIDAGENFITAKMPISEKVLQYDKVLHGGASAALAETVGSLAAIALYGKEDHIVRGIEVSANHVKSVSQGNVYAKAICLHPGRTLQVWDIKITDDQNRLISICKLTTITLKKEK